MSETAAIMNDQPTPVLLDRDIKPFLINCMIGGGLIRVFVALISRGSNDAAFWFHFAALVKDHGLLGAYRYDQMINHPLPSLMWARFALYLGGQTGFAFLMKLPAMTGDMFACVLVAKIWMNRGDARRAKLAVMAIAFNPLAILVSAYHCNTDSAFAMLSLLAMYCIAEGRGFFVAGLALGAAINVKLVPLLLIPAAASFCRNRKELLSLIKGLALWVIPFVPLLLIIDAVYHNMVAYMPQHERWGISLFLYQLYLQPGWGDFANKAMDTYSVIGRGLIIVGVLWFAAVQWRRRVWNPYEMGLLTYATFLVLAPGFGVQYTIMLLPLMVAVSIAGAWAYSLMAGTFLFLVYYMSLIPGQFPLISFFVGPVLPMPGPLFGLVAWIILWIMVVKLGQRGWGAPAQS